jgi:acetolactate synthase I/III small subunit
MAFFLIIYSLYYPNMEAEKERKYTISVFTENKYGLLSRITLIFTRRKINIDSLTVSESEMKDVFRFTMVIRATADTMQKVQHQLEKQVEVLKAFYYEDKDIVYQEIAMFKMPPSAFVHGGKVEQIVRESAARVLSIEPEFIVLEKTGHEYEVQELFEKLKPYGLLSFVRSGRVAIAKPMKRLFVHLKEMEETPLYV